MVTMPRSPFVITDSTVSPAGSVAGTPSKATSAAVAPTVRSGSGAPYVSC